MVLTIQVIGREKDMTQETVEEKIANDELVNCTEDEKKEIQSAIENVRELLSNTNESTDSIKDSFEQLQKLLEGKLN